MTNAATGARPFSSLSRSITKLAVTRTRNVNGAIVGRWPVHSGGRVRGPRNNRVVTAPVCLSAHTDKSISRIRFIGRERDKVREKSALSVARRHEAIDFRSIQRDGLSPGLDSSMPECRDTSNSRSIFLHHPSWSLCACSFRLI